MAAAAPTVPPRRPRPLPLCHLPLLLLFLLLLLLLRPATPATAETSEQPSVAVAFLADSFSTASFTADPPQLLALGDALLLPGADGVQLAGSGPGTAGRLLLAQPVTMQTSHQYGKSCASFSTAFQFSMAPIAASGAAGAGTGAGASAGPGDGLAFALVPDNVSVEWGSLGLVSLEEMQAAAAGWVHPRRAAPAPGVVAVELDAFRDPEFLDPNDNHVGLDVDTLVSLATANASDAGVRLRSDRTACAWIDYDAFRKVVEVRLSPACASRPAVPLLAFDIDLRSLVQDRVFVGFSASSSAGWTAVRPRVHSWCFGSGSGEAGYPFRYCDFQRRPAIAPPGAVEVVPVYRNVLAVKNALVPAPDFHHQHPIPQQQGPAELDQLQDEDDWRPHNLTDTTGTQGGDSRHEHTTATSQLPVDASQENSKRTTETAGKAAQVQQQQQPKRKRAAGGGHSVVLMGSLFVALISLVAFVSYKKYTAGVRERRSHFQDMFQQPGRFGYQELITTSGPRFA